LGKAYTYLRSMLRPFLVTPRRFRFSASPACFSSVLYRHRAFSCVPRPYAGLRLSPVCRSLCTTPTTAVKPTHDVKPDKLTWRDFLTFGGLKNLYKTRRGTLASLAIMGGVGMALYFVLRGGYAMADFFVTINFHDVATISFVAGLATAGVIAVILSYTRRLFVIKPELVYQKILQRVQADPRVGEMLGSSVTPGKFRAYALSEGGLTLAADKADPGSGWSRFWKPKKLQMMFQLQGSQELGMVSFEAKKEFNGDLLFTSLVVDGLKTGQKLILEGDGSDKVYQGIIKLR